MKNEYISLMSYFLGLTCFKEGVPCIPIDSIPGIHLTGYRPPPERIGTSRSMARSQDDPDVLYNSFKTILNAVKNHQV